MEEQELAFWRQAANRGLPRLRWLRRSVAPEKLDNMLTGTRLEEEWLHLKVRMQPRDQIWPFEFHVRRYLGMRRGFLVLRNGQPIGGVVTEKS